ncbi:MAG TPA: hypothetical protein VHK27_09120 [Gammaproteobacteria bacterium]|nr:hypothetical protein [Gammaproteobacteria bacterium]
MPPVQHARLRTRRSDHQSLAKRSSRIRIPTLGDGIARARVFAEGVMKYLRFANIQSFIRSISPSMALDFLLRGKAVQQLFAST